MVEGVAHGELAHIELAQQNCSGILELAHHRSIIVRHVVAEDFRAAGGGDASGAKLVFHRHGHAVEWPPVLSSGDFRFGLPGFRPSLLGGDSDVGIQHRVHLLDAGQISLRRLHWRHLARPEQFRQLGCAEEGNFVAVHKYNLRLRLMEQ